MADDQPFLRVGDAERDEAVEVLQQHCGEGRLTLEEFAERMTAALGAKTQAELGQVMADLPQPALPERQGSRVKSSWTVALMSGSSRRGRWRPAAHNKVVAVMGGCDLDLRQAEIVGPEVHITAVAFMGGVDIVVPEGFPVELSGVPIFGGKDLKVADTPRVPGAPLIRIRAFPIMGGVQVRTKRRRQPGDDSAEAVGSTRVKAGLGGVDDPPLPATSVETTREGKRPTKSAPPQGTVTILFSDVADYTALTERLGDEAAAKVLALHNETMRNGLASHGGYEVKVQGDGFMAAFGGAREALRCAVEVQRAIEHRNSVSQPRIELHMGLNSGEAIRDGEDFQGRAVIVASRIADVAERRQVLVSSLVRELASASPEFKFGSAVTVQLKGVSDPQLVYPLEWE